MRTFRDSSAQSSAPTASAPFVALPGLSIDGMSDDMRHKLMPPSNNYESQHRNAAGAGGDDLGVGEGLLSSLGIDREQVLTFTQNQKI